MANILDHPDKFKPPQIDSAVVEACAILAKHMKSFTFKGVGNDGNEYGLNWDSEHNQPNKSRDGK